MSVGCSRFATLLPYPCGGLVSSRARCPTCCYPCLPDRRVCFPSYSLAGLDSGGFGQSDFSQTLQSLPSASTYDRIAAFLVFLPPAARAFRPWMQFYVWNNVLMFVRLRQPCSGRDVVPPFVSQSQNTTNCMFIIFSFRPECAPRPINCSQARRSGSTRQMWPPCAAYNRRPCRRTSASQRIGMSCPWRWRHDCPE